MHICLLTPSLLPAVYGGVPIASGRAATSLLRAGHQITALTVPSPEHSRNTSLSNTDLAGAYPGLRLYYRLPQDPLHEPEAVDLLCDWVQQQPFDVILAYFMYPSGYLATVLGERLGLPVVCSCRGSDISTGVFDAPATLTTVLQRSTRLIFVSTFLLHMADTLVACRAKATVVPNAVDADRFTPVESAPDSSRPLTIGTCGQLRWKKGIDLFLPLARQLCHTQAVRVLIAGHGLYDADERQINTYIQHHDLTCQIEKTGPIPHHDIVHTLRRMDMYVHTSYQEGMPNAVLEAMACGLPIVTTDAGDTSHIVEHGVTGFVCPRGDIEALAAHCRTLIEQPALRRQMGQAGRHRVMQCFHPAREASAIEAILREACALHHH